MLKPKFYPLQESGISGHAWGLVGGAPFGILFKDNSSCLQERTNPSGRRNSCTEVASRAADGVEHV